MNAETVAQTKFGGLTIQVPSPDGTMFVTVMEDENGKPLAIDVHIGKAGAPIAAWANAFARILSLALDHGATINDLVRELSNVTSDRRRDTVQGEPVRSGVEALWVALVKYKRDRFEQVSKTLGDVNVRGRGSRLGG